MNASKKFMDSTVGKTVGLMGGKERGCHWMLLVTSVILLTVGIYGTIVSSEYGCGNGINIKLNDMKGLEKLVPVSVPPECTTLPFNVSACENAVLMTGNELYKCIGSDRSNVGKLDRCLNDHGHGDVRCMEGGMMTFSIISIIVGSLMLIMSMYMLFM